MATETEKSAPWWLLPLIIILVVGAFAVCPGAKMVKSQTLPPPMPACEQEKKAADDAGLARDMCYVDQDCRPVKNPDCCKAEADVATAARETLDRCLEPPFPPAGKSHKAR